MLTAVESSCKSVVDKALSSFSKGSDKASSKGSALGNSFARGIRGAIPSAVSAAQELVDAVNAVLSKIQMPSLSVGANTSNLSSMVSSGVTSATGSSVAGASAGLAASIASGIAGSVFGKGSGLSKALAELRNSGRGKTGRALKGSSTNVTNNYTFNQTNNSPVALSNKEIYRQTKNQFSQLKGALK